MKRIDLLKKQLLSQNSTQIKSNTKKTPIPLTSYEYLDFDSFLTKEEIEYRKKLRKFLKEEIQPQMNDYNNNSLFPRELIQKLIENFPGLTTTNLKGCETGLANMSNNLAFVISLELFRSDMSFATSVFHQTALVLDTFLSLGSKEQIDYYAPKLINYSILGSWNLTEPDYGSDATSIKTNAVKQGDSFIINGRKKWAANVTVADFFIIWAYYEGQIRGFIVDSNLEGVTRSKIEGKLSLRAVQNGEIELKNVKIPISNLLPRGENFSKGLSQMLLRTRLGTAIAAVGACMEAYDETAKYLSQRVQFGKPLTSFQLVQEKLVVSLSNIQAMLYYCKRTYDQSYSNEGISMGKAAICKAFCTQKSRETIRMLRELWGGNGIISTNLVMRILADLESLHTYEGTYEINTLIAGREITGIAAFK